MLRCDVAPFVCQCCEKAPFVCLWAAWNRWQASMGKSPFFLFVFRIEWVSIATASNNLRSIPGASINYTGVFTFCPMGSIPCAGTFRISQSLWCERILCVCSWSWWKGNRSSLGVVCFQLTCIYYIILYYIILYYIILYYIILYYIILYYIIYIYIIYVYIVIYIYIILYRLCNMNCNLQYYPRTFRSQTSDNMDRWKSRGGKSQRREEKKKEDQRREWVRRLGLRRVGK